MKRRRATTIVEFAVVSPFLLAILLGIIEYGWVFMVRQTLQAAAREGCRVAILQTSEPPFDAANKMIRRVMKPTGTEVDIEWLRPVGEKGPVVEVNITVPYDEVSLVGGFFGTHDYDIGGTCSMTKEGY